MTAIEHLKAQPIAVSVIVGLFASLCCRGSLIFASIELGANLMRLVVPQLMNGESR
jgi:hypothetical protein